LKLGIWDLEFGYHGRAERDRTADLFRVKEALIPTELRPYERRKILA
jgi:hypothetical protein